MRRPFDPDEEILHYCEHICNANIQTRRNNKRYGTWYWDYPAIAAKVIKVVMTYFKVDISNVLIEQRMQSIKLD